MRFGGWSGIHYRYAVMMKQSGFGLAGPNGGQERDSRKRRQ